MVLRREVLLGGAVVLGGVALWVVVDLLTVSERERLEAFSEAVTGEITDESIEAAQAYVDLEAQPLDVYVDNTRHRFEQGEGERFRTWVVRAAAPVVGEQVRRMDRTIEIDGEQATVILRALTPMGISEMTYELRRLPEGWRIRTARIRPRAGTIGL